MRIRPSEHKAVQALLEEPAESTHELATDIILAIDALRAARTDYVSIVEQAPGFVMVYGPYVTKNAAYRDFGKSVFSVMEGARSMVLPLTTSIEEGLENEQD